MMGLLSRTLRRLPGRSLFRRKPRVPAPKPLDANTWLQDLGLRGWSYAALEESALASLRARFPNAVATTVEVANRHLAHQFQFLGSGWFDSVDPNRPAHPDGYRPIDWRLDPVRGLRFPGGFPKSAWSMEKMRPGMADIKYPWELGRCQHFGALGQAYRLTGQSHFAREIARQIDDFLQSEPVGVGVQWVCTMDVGLRAANWVVALGLIHDCTDLEPDFLARAAQALLDHGRFIHGNLENHYEVTSNHYLSNLVGLFYLGDFFRSSEEGRHWLSFARSEIEKEMVTQVLPDGADYESSVPYHRLVTELFLGCARLASFRREPFSPNYQTKLRQMVEFLFGVLRPDGKMPQLGDADDGRLHLLSTALTPDPQDARHLLGPAAAFFNETRWLEAATDESLWEAAWWGLGLPDAPAAIPPRDSRPLHFPEAGVTVFRDNEHYLLVTNGVVGTKGFGNHKHNDQLSFEFHRKGIPILVDPGSFVYTCDPESRNRFRSTRYHNTLAIQGEEQNELRPEYLFRLFAHADPVTLAVSADDASFEYLGYHRGYERLPTPWRHGRSLRLLRREGVLLLVDAAVGKGIGRVDWHFHFAPGVTLTLDSDERLLVSVAGEPYVLTYPRGARVTLGDAGYSPSYGVQIPCQAADLSIDLPNGAGSGSTWGFALGPESWFNGPDSGSALETLWSQRSAQLLTALEGRE